MTVARRSNRETRTTLDMRLSGLRLVGKGLAGLALFPLAWILVAHLIAMFGR